jgi:hypothetical protein
MIPNLNSICLGSTRCYLDCLIDVKGFFESYHGGGYETFLLKNNEEEDEQFCFASESKKLSSESEVECFRQFLSLSGGSRFESGSSFSIKKSNSSIEMIQEGDFNEWESLREVIFSQGSHLRV